MGKFDLGVNLAKEVSACVRTSGRSLLQTRPAGKINIEGLRYAPHLEGDVIKITNAEKIITESNVYVTILKAKIHLYDNERKGLEEILVGKTEKEADKILNAVKEYKTYGRSWDRYDGSFEEEASNVGKFIEFLVTKGKLDSALAEKSINLVKEKPYLATVIDGLSRFKDSSSELKTKLVDLVKKMDSYLEHSPLEAFNGTTDTQLAKIIRNFVGFKNPTAKQLERIKMLEKLTDEGVGLSNFEKLLEVNPNLTEQFLKISFPSKEISELFQANPEEVLKVLTKFKNRFGVKNIDVDRYGFDLLSKNDNQIQNIIEKQLKNIKNPGEYEFKLGEDALFPDNIAIGFSSEKENQIINLFFDKTQKVLNHEEISSVIGNKFLVKSNDFTHNTYIEQLMDEAGKLISESKVVKSPKGEILYTDSLVQSAVEGQNDLYRIFPNGKVQVLSKAFKDPQTGETVIKKSLESVNKTKTEYMYRSLSDGSWKSTHNIVDKDGKELLNIERTYKMIDENHFVSTIKDHACEPYIGNEFKITLNGDELLVKYAGGNSIIDLKKLIPSGDKNLRDMIIHLPGDELVKISEYSTVQTIERNLADINNTQLIEFFDAKIQFGNNLINNRSVLLHEYGHNYAKQWSNIAESVEPIYKKELEAFRNRTSKTEVRQMDYLIDNKYHYKSGLEECIADVNALVNYPNDFTAIADRVLRFQQNFPETFAEIAKSLT